MWRWLVPYGLTAIPVTVILFAGQLYLPWTDVFPRADAYRLGAVSVAWLTLMVMASPTILYYRLLIFAGERAVPRRPRTAVAILLLLGGIAAPLVQNWLAGRASLARDFTGPAPGPADSVIIASRDGPVGRSHCAQACARLLFGGGARRVIVAEPGAEGLAPAVQVAQRSTCPPVTERYGEQDLPGRPTVSIQFPDGETGDRLLAQIASGRCLVATAARTDEAGLRLGEGWVLRQQPVPDGFALINGDFRFVERRENGQWVRLSQRMGQSLSFHWLYPFAFLPNREGWIAGLRRYTYVHDSVPSNPQPWRWAGVTLPEVPGLGWQRVRELLRAAVALPANAPRDARHQLARQYLTALQRRPADDIDRALLRRLPQDPRIDGNDLGELARANAHARGERAPAAPDYASGARLAGEDLGPLGTRKYAAFAFDVGMLVALHLIALFVAIQVSRSRRQARLQRAQGQGSG